MDVHFAATSSGSSAVLNMRGFKRSVLCQNYGVSSVLDDVPWIVGVAIAFRPNVIENVTKILVHKTIESLLNW